MLNLQYQQGMLYATPDCVRNQLELVRLWTHETLRVYKDKLVDEKDQELFEKIHTEVVKNAFEVRKNYFLCCMQLRMKSYNSLYCTSSHDHAYKWA